jgi:hypothetical protein
VPSSQTTAPVTGQWLGFCLSLGSGSRERSSSRATVPSMQQFSLLPKYKSKEELTLLDLESAQLGASTRARDRDVAGRRSPTGTS